MDKPMDEHTEHRFVVELVCGAHTILLHDEQMEAVLSGERRVIEGTVHVVDRHFFNTWWYFNDVGLGLLRVEHGEDPERTTVAWEGRIHDAYVGTQPSAPMQSMTGPLGQMG